MSADPDPTASPLTWTDDGQPRSRLYGDVYFSTADGLAESRAVFLAGCGLPDAWRGRGRFVVGELGFGTGLNILALLDLWRREGPAGGRLHVFSIEAHPLSAAEATRALGAWPELADLAEMFTLRWPGAARGVHRVELPELRAILDVAVMDVAPALEGWAGRADAWFLDGFAPAANPAMWRDEVLALVAQRSAPGARAATFTVAGAVRRGLAQAGFEVAKRSGFGRKRERLEARLAGRAPADPSGPRVAIVGGGIAGAAAARAVRALGGKALLIEAEALGAGASGNPAALVTPRLDAGLGDAARLFAQAFARAVQLYETIPEAVIARGVVQLAARPADADRFARIAAGDLFEPGALALLAPETSARLTGAAPRPGLDQVRALVVEPQAILSRWAGETRPGRVASLEQDGATWILRDGAGQAIAQAEAVILAAGLDNAAFAPGLPLSAVRGQVSWTSFAGPVPAAAWGGYVAPTRQGLIFGATHDRGDAGTDLRDDDHARNLATLAETLPDLAAPLQGARLEGRASVRAVTPDRLPVAGPAPDGRRGLYVLAGFGSRGFAHAPLLAEHVAALALGAPSPLPSPLQAVVDPGRFAARAARRGGSGARRERL